MFRYCYAGRGFAKVVAGNYMDVFLFLVFPIRTVHLEMPPPKRRTDRGAPFSQYTAASTFVIYNSSVPSSAAPPGHDTFAWISLGGLEGGGSNFLTAYTAQLQIHCGTNIICRHGVAFKPCPGNTIRAGCCATMKAGNYLIVYVFFVSEQCIWKRPPSIHIWN